MKKKFTFTKIILIVLVAATFVYYVGFVKSTASAMEINVISKKVVLKSNLSGVAMKAKIVTCKTDNKTWYKTTYYTYGKNPLPMWTTVKYLPGNRPVNPVVSGNWTIFNKFRSHNSILKLNFPAVSWKYKQYDAISLKGLFPSVNVLGKTRGAVMFTQFVGDSVGVSYYNGIIYIPSNNDMLYAVNAKTGKLIWRATAAGSVMSVPLAVNGVVYITIGNAAFSGANGPY
ncbi:MAG: PQQ-binding-like beta-propeller repeat protein, partial [Candidatus Acidulodesulfobacterium sp.]